MARDILALNGDLRHGDAEALAADLRAALEDGPVWLDLSDVTRVEFAPVQVLLAAGAQARRLKRDFAVIAPKDGALAQALDAHALRGALPLHALTARGEIE